MSIECGPWMLAVLHIPTGQRADRMVKPDEKVTALPDGRRTIEDRRGFLEFVNWCNANQPGVWQYWERAS